MSPTKAFRKNGELSLQIASKCSFFVNNSGFAADIWQLLFPALLTLHPFSFYQTSLFSFSRTLLIKSFIFSRVLQNLFLFPFQEKDTEDEKIAERNLISSRIQLLQVCDALIREEIERESEFLPSV
ncbi:hypothetical protein AVEN_124981-1 [Araneus ventricosus]|uniref:Uncharacterized protein n=1 Tax=Araneus ventricosus TaxID=182803 RepID=A0A4Y2EEH9_ARAVE|nr:hypothetical protein AVEN_124981-1 [Araneus ventricosus]